MICVGIDIGSSSIKVAEIESNNRVQNINRFEVFPLSTDPNKDTEIEILDIIRNLSHQYDQLNTRFVLGVETRQVSVRRRLFPFKERHKILKSLAFELEDDIPLSQNDAIFDAKVTRYIDDSSDVIALACPKVNILKLVQLCEDCHINLEVVSVNGLAFANLFEKIHEAPPSLMMNDNEEFISSPAQLILDIGFTTTTMLVFKNNYLLEVRTFDWGGKDVATSLANKYSMHFVEAQRELELKNYLLLNNEDVTADQIAYSDTIKKSIDNFSQQLFLTLLELKSKYNINITKASYTGGLSQIKNLGAYLTQRVEVPFARHNVLTQNLNLNLNFTAKDSDGFLAGVAMGLALEGIKKPKNPAINFLKDDLAKQSQTLKILIERWSYTLSILAAAFVFFVVYGLIRENFALEMSNQSYTLMKQQAKSIAGLKGTKASPSGIKKFISTQKKILKNRKHTEALQKINSPLDILKAISNVVPSKQYVALNIKRFFVENESVQIEGEIQNASMLKQLDPVLRALSKDGKVQSIPTQIKAQKGWKSFGFSFPIERLKGGKL